MSCSTTQTISILPTYTDTLPFGYSISDEDDSPPSHHNTPPTPPPPRCCDGHGVKPNLSTTMKKAHSMQNGLQWGSDPSFCFHGFSCPVGSWTEERLVQNLMRNTASLRDSLSIDFGAAAYFATTMEPEEQAEVVNLDRFELSSSESPFDYEQLGMQVSPVAPHSETTHISQNQPISGPIKETTDIPQHQVMSPRGKQERQIKRTHKKRKCVQGPDQKLCHCQSEKRRRELISRRYRDLCQVVPGLGNKLYTRRYILDETARWIVHLLEGNEALRRQRDQLSSGSAE